VKKKNHRRSTTQEEENLAHHEEQKKEYTCKLDNGLKIGKRRALNAMEWTPVLARKIYGVRDMKRGNPNQAPEQNCTMGNGRETWSPRGPKND